MPVGHRSGSGSSRSLKSGNGGQMGTVSHQKVSGAKKPPKVKRSVKNEGKK